MLRLLAHRIEPRKAVHSSNTYKWTDIGPNAYNCHTLMTMVSLKLIMYLKGILVIKSYRVMTLQDAN